MFGSVFGCYQPASYQVSLVAVMGGVYPATNAFTEFNFNCGMNLMGPPMECAGRWTRQTAIFHAILTTCQLQDGGGHDAA